MLPSVLPKLGTDSAVRRFPGVWKLLSLKTPFPGRNSVPPSFVSFFVFYIFSYLLSKSWNAFLGAWCPLPAFRSCFVECTRRLNSLLMNLWGRKCSPCPTPPPSWLLPLGSQFLNHWTTGKVPGHNFLIALFLVSTVPSFPSFFAKIHISSGHTVPMHEFEPCTENLQTAIRNYLMTSIH